MSYYRDRQRRYPRKQRKLLDAIDQGLETPAAIAERTGQSLNAVRTACSKMVGTGLLGVKYRRNPIPGRSPVALYFLMVKGDNRLRWLRDEDPERKPVSSWYRQ